MTLSITDLFTAQTVAQWEQSLLNLATTVGLTTTAWQPGGVTRTIINILANALATEDQIVSIMAQGGFLDTAAQTTVTPQGGPGWLDLLSSSVYNDTRIAATFASGTITFTNASASTYGPFAAGTFHVANPATGKTYKNTASLTIAPSTTTTANFQADLSGSSSTSAPGTITQLVTSLIGVTCTNAAAFVGSDAETNAALAARDRLKLQSLSPNGPKGAYVFFALTSSQIDPTISAPITRALAQASTFSGTVVTTIANAAGAPSGGDVSKVDAVIQANCVPLAVTATTQAATNHSVTVAVNVWVPASDSGSVTSKVQTAITTYFANLPIGGLSDPSLSYTNVVPFDAVLGVVFESDANIQQATLTLNGGTSNVSLGVTDVAVISGPVSVTVHVV